MSDSRRDFVQHLDALKHSLSLQDVLNASNSGRSASKLLRNGLAVVSFNALEDFFKRRVGEITLEIAKNNVPFHVLNEKLQAATTFELISSLSFQVKNIKKHLDVSEKIQFAHEQASHIFSTSNTIGYTLSPYAYGYGASNIDHEVIAKAFKALDVSAPWDKITSLSNRLGLVSLPLKDEFVTAAAKRHAAAHAANNDALHGDLQSFLLSSTAIAVSMDILLTEACARILKHCANYTAPSHAILQVEDITYYRVKYDSRKWKIHSSQRLDGRALRAFNSLEDAIGFSTAKSRSERCLTLVYDSGNNLKSWH